MDTEKLIAKLDEIFIFQQNHHLLLQKHCLRKNTL